VIDDSESGAVCMKCNLEAPYSRSCSVGGPLLWEDHNSIHTFHYLVVVTFVRDASLPSWELYHNALKSCALCCPSLTI
jgi:hypothetical protein